MFDLEPTITLPWLVRLRWLFAVGNVVAYLVVRLGFGIVLPWWPFAVAIVIQATSNLAIVRVKGWSPGRTMGAALVLDTVLLTVQLAGLGGATNPFTVMYLVYITLSAVVLSARWTTAIAALATAGFALLFAVPAEMHVHHSGPPLLNPHLQGMWAAFVIAAGLTAFFVRRISRAIATQREQIAELREVAARSARHASLTTLAAGAAHELNTPLSTIAVAAHEAGLAASKLPAASSVAADLELIQAQVDRCQQILHRMAARVTEGTSGPADVATLVGELRAQLGERAARVDVAVSGTPERIALPLAPTVQSLLALVHNGLDASPPEARVRVELVCEPAAIAICVEDRGPGIPDEQLARVGEPFFTTKAPGQGLGLGVYLARMFFESQGGTLTFRSGATGTRACARLPVGGTA